MNEDIITISDTDSSEQSIIRLQQPEIKVDEPIDSSATVQDSETNVISISSQSLQRRCAVSEENTFQKHKYLNAEDFYSPSPKAKVSDWLFANSQASNDFKTVNLAAPSIDKKSSILIRQDYRKTNLGIPTLIDNTINRSLNGNSSNDTVIHLSSGFMESIKEINGGNLSQTVENNRSNSCDILVQNRNTRVISNASENSASCIEVPNKVELCEYLKLMNMNPIERNDGVKQNRRSSRVKNLAILSERKALERELNNANSDQEKKKRNFIDLEVNSCIGSDSSKESIGVSQNTDGSVQKNSSTKNSVAKQSSKGDDVLYSFVPMKSLQVPEVSTTSLSRRKSLGDETILNEEGYSNKNLKGYIILNDGSKLTINNTKRKLNATPNTSSSDSKSAILTKKSFSELNIDLNNFKETQNALTQNFHYCMLKYLCTRPQVDFDDFYTDYMNHLDKVEKTENQKRKAPRIDKNVKKPKKQQINNNRIKYRLRRNLNLKDNSAKLKHRQTKDKFKIKHLQQLKKNQQSMKGQRRLKLYLRTRNLTKLRSRGKLKEIGIKSILLNHDRKRKVKKKFKAKSTQVTPKQKEKDYKATELIQTGDTTEPLSRVNDTTEEQKITNLPSPQTEFPPIKKLLRLKSDIDNLKNLTPEHRKALFESKKFLIVKSKENTPSKTDCNSSTVEPVEDKVNTDNIEKADKTTETVPQCDISESPKLVDVALQTQIQMDLSRPCSEDVEVDTFMNQDHSQNVSKTYNMLDDPLQNAVVEDPWQRESESSKSQTTSSSSLDTVSSIRESANSAPNEEIFGILAQAELFEQNDHVIEEIVECSSLPEDDVKMDEECSDDLENEPEVIDIADIKRMNIDCIHLVDDNEAKIESLHQCLTQPKKKLKERSEICDQDWDECLEPESSTKNDKKAFQSYAIDLSRSNGAVMNAYYLDFNLVVVQELLISFWNQTSLGNMLGAQDMWMPKGDTKRLVLGNGCTCQDSSETIMVLDTSIAYFELWTKEHKSDKRERPVADIFVTIYFRLTGAGPEKKVLQLENIHGYANDVQYIVIKNSPIIVVSWNTVNDQLTSTVVHKYRLSPDYQSVTNITSMQAAAHYVSSLHNIEDSDTLIMGCGEDKITLWHIDHGYVVASMDLMAISQQPRTLWAKADRGFIFTLHNFNDGHLHLIATNSFDYSWKQLQVYKQESEHENLLGICIENGLVVAFYDTGILCWKAKSGELILDTASENSIFLPFGKHIILMVENQVHVRHVLEYLVTIEEDS